MENLSAVMCVGDMEITTNEADVLHTSKHLQGIIWILIERSRSTQSSITNRKSGRF